MPPESDSPQKFARMFSRFRHPYRLLAPTALFWSGNMVLGCAIRNEVPPLSLAFWRRTTAPALTLPLAPGPRNA